VNRDLRPVLVIVAVVAFVVLGVISLRETSVVVEELPTVDIGSPGDTSPTGAPIATVIGKRQVAGGSFLWFRRGDDRYEVTVQFFAPPECVDPVAEGGTWPTIDSSCASAVPISGTIGGSGIAATGEAIVAVIAEVSGACHGGIAVGDLWPPEAEECAPAVG
jgi:hypothetical protein